MFVFSTDDIHHLQLENSRVEIEQLKEKEVLQGKRIVSLEKQISMYSPEYTKFEQNNLMIH